MRHKMVLVSVLAGLGLLTWSPAARPAPADNDTQKIVYMSDAGPVLIELHLRIDGQSFRAAHRAFLDTLFDHLDRDSDGMLSRAEAATAPSAQALSSPLALIGFARQANTSGRLVPDRDGKVTREGLAAHYRRTGLAAFQMSSTPVQLPQLRLAQLDNNASADQLTDRLFRLLDTDKDGKLSRKELEAAPDILGTLDIDEDEMITPDELMGVSGDSSGYRLDLVLSPAPPASSSRWLHFVADRGDDEVLARALLARYGKGKEKSLAGSMLGLSREASALLDRDGDGRLSLAELARFADKPADVTVTVRFGDGTDSPVTTLERDRPLPAGVEAKTTAEGVMLKLGTTRLDLHTIRPIEGVFPINLQNQLRTRFRMADSNMDGYLDRMEARKTGFFANHFDAMDRDGDGKVSEKELLAYFKQMESLSKMAGRSCVSLAFTSEGKGLFDLLDSNGDGKLSVRELRNAHRLLRLDADSDGNLARGEVPRHHRAGLALGPNGGNDPLRRVAVVAAPRRGAPVVRRAVERGPLWFRKMDRNRDGDVSRKEFVGSDEQFKEIDTDGDGLISLEEAERHDKRKRGGRE